MAGFFLALAAVAAALAGLGGAHEGRRPRLVRGGLALAVAALAPLVDWQPQRVNEDLNLVARSHV